MPLVTRAEERVLQGQVFVVTNAGESVKLGLVEVAGYPRDQIEEMIKETDASLSRARSETATMMSEVAKALLRSKALEERLQEAWLHGDDMSTHSAAYAAHETAETKSTDLDLLNLRLERLDHFLHSSRPYFDVFPKALVRTKTDADGRFTLRLPDGRQSVVAATAERLAGSKTELYSWVVLAESDVNSGFITLSNDNMATQSDDRSILHTLYEAGSIGDGSWVESIKADYQSLVIGHGSSDLPKAITLTMPVEIPNPDYHLQDPLKFGRGRSFPVVTTSGDTIRVRYLNYVIAIPISATDFK